MAFDCNDDIIAYLSVNLDDLTDLFHVCSDHNYEPNVLKIIITSRVMELTQTVTFITKYV